MAVADGALYLLPGSYARPLRRVVGVTIDVGRLDVATARLDSARVPFRRLTARGGRQSLLVGPDDAHGIWLELRAEPS